MNSEEPFPDVSGVTRFEVIDHTPCKTCKGKRLVMVEGAIAPVECPACQGIGCLGRAVVFWDPKKELDLSLQDQGRTLKVFIKERGKE